MSPKTMDADEEAMDSAASRSQGRNDDRSQGRGDDVSFGGSAIAQPVSGQKQQKSVTVHDVIGSTSMKPPVEQESESRVLKSVEHIDLNEGQPEGDEETKRLFQDMIAADVAARASAVIRRGSVRVNPETEPLTSRTDDLFRDTITLNNDDNHRKIHRRKQTVEERLFGLTSALAELKSEKSSNGDPSASFIQGGFSNPTSDGLTKTANVLVEHANDMADEQANDIEAQKPGSPASSNSDEENEAPRKNRFSIFQSAHIGAVKEDVEAQYAVFNEFLGERKAKATLYLRRLFLYCVLPSLGIATLLFYAFDNPIAGSEERGDPSKYASYSWWFLFLGVRQPITLSMAFITQALVIDFFVLRTRSLMKWVGPLGTLLFVQARGWPFVAFFWGTYDLALLSGRTAISDHWLFWQNAIGMFNKENPSGGITSSRTNFLFIALSMVVGAAVSVKRVVVSLVLGRQTFAHFGEQLADIMKNMVLIGSVAAISRSIEKANSIGADDHSSALPPGHGVTHGNKALQDLVAQEATAFDAAERDATLAKPNAVDAAKTFIKKTTTANESSGSRKNLNGEFTESEHMKMTELLGSWEDTQTAHEKAEKKISIGSVLQFRQALTMMNAKYPFTLAFGIADTREACVDSAQQVFERLMLRTPGEAALPFETLALLAKDIDGEFDEETAKALIQIFRPDREGNLNRLDFVKSIDSVYKSIRLLSANISNSRHTDAAVESIINFVFWFFVVTFVMTELGIDPWALLLSLSSIIISISFVLGSSAAKYFEGMLFILMQRPYGVGDRIHLSQPDTDTSIDGSSGWIVEKLSLSTTSVYWGATNERATIANGAISNFRVINSARSPNAQIYVNLKFAVDTPYDKLETFRAATEQYLKDRPREWLAFNGFRPTEVAVDRGYTNYVIVAQHRSSWQDIGAILGSKADLVKFCMEVTKQLDMRFTSPPLPVDLTLKGASSGELTPAGITALSSE